MKVINCKSVFVILIGLWNISTSNPETIQSGHCLFSFTGQQYALVQNHFENYGYMKYLNPKITCLLYQDDEIIETKLPDDFKFQNGSYQSLDVILEGSNIHVLKSTLFYNIREIDKLNLANCNITPIADNAFDKLTNLIELNLNENNIKSVKGQVFEKLLNMTILKMNNNYLTSFDVTLVATTFLDLSFNEIQYVNITCDNLLNLNLTNNNMENLLQSNFDNIKNLQRLYLNNNNISSISGGIFHNLIKLLHLNLSGNNLNSIMLSSFLGLEDLNELILDNNKLSYIDIHAFHDLQSLRELSLVGNLIRTLDTILFAKSTLPQLKTISLNKNPWDCQNLVDIMQLSKQRENAIIINKGDDRTNSSIMGIACENKDVLSVKIGNVDNRVVSATNTEFRSKFDSVVLLQVGNNIISKLDMIIKQLNITKLNDNSNFSQFLNKEFQNTEFARFFTSNFKNLAFFKYFEKQMINLTISSVLNQAKSMDENNTAINAIIDNLAHLMKQFNSTCANDLTNNPQEYLNAEKLISPDTSAARKTDSLILGLLCFLTIIVISMLFMVIAYFYNRYLYRAKEQLVNYIRGDSESKVTMEELECL